MQTVDSKEDAARFKLMLLAGGGRSMLCGIFEKS